MKSDPSGTPREQARHQAGWLTATQAKASQVANRCRDCRHYTAPLDSYDIWGSHLRGSRCELLDLATKPLATCAKWEAKP